MNSRIILFAAAAISSAATASCASTDRRFALAPPLAVDSDLRSVVIPCRAAPSDKDKSHIACAPEPYVSPLVWDGVDNMLFRPLAEAWTFEAAREATNANSLDEVADSAWFTNRIGARTLTREELLTGACKASQLLGDTSQIADGAWLIDKGKQNGSSPGFRIKIPGKGKFLLKVDDPTPERPSAASVIGADAYHAVGFNFSCEQVVYVKPSVFKLAPGLTMVDNTSRVRPFDRAALEKMLEKAPRKGGAVRFQASAWLEGDLIGPFRYEKTRDDDPNDVIPHEDRRELRGARVLAAWLDHFDAREQNSMDAWMADRKDDPDSSPGHVVHYYLDTSDCLGSEWDWEIISRRLGKSYIVDWGDIAQDFVTLGIPVRPWDSAARVPGREMFGFFRADNFVPDEWKNEYPNPAFSRMTERDGAWMARILARMTPDLVKALASAGQFSDPANEAYLAGLLEVRLEKILDRYLTRLSPVGDVHLEHDQLCATDLAASRSVRDPASFHYAVSSGGAWLTVFLHDPASFCVAPPHHAADGGVPDNDPSRYFRVEMSDGVAPGPLHAYLYDLGPTRGFRLVGIDRPEH
jgi:hypothetical protein